MSITEQLEAERRIIKAATGGCWWAEHGAKFSGIDSDEDTLLWDDHMGEVLRPADAEFIAHARTALPLRNAQVDGALRALDDYAPPSKQEDPTGAVLAHMERLEQAVRTAIREAQ